MDPLYEALIYLKNKKYDKCIEHSTKILNKTPLDQTAWALKMRAMTRKVQIDEMDIEGINGLGEYQESIWNDTIATAPRPGTSLRNPTRATTALRRPGTGSYGTMTARAVTAGRPRTSHTPATARASLATAQARALRLGTATIATNYGEVFIQVNRLNLTKYAQDKSVSKPLFEYLFYHEGDYRHAMELAVQATKVVKYLDWWWKVALSKCYSAFNLKRDAEQQLRSAVKQHRHVETYLRLARVCTQLDQPATALEVCHEGINTFPADVQLMTEQARLFEAIGDMAQSVKIYRLIAIQDAMNIEAIASIAFHHFYNDQPEMALRYYRRVLAMGAYSAEVFNNVALCCMRAQYWDLTLTCYRRALLLATEVPILADIWYNLSHLALGIGDVNLAIQCLRLCISYEPCHAAALNNLAGLEVEKGNKMVSKSLYAAAISADPTLTEALTNLKIVEEFDY